MTVNDKGKNYKKKAKEQDNGEQNKNTQSSAEKQSSTTNFFNSLLDSFGPALEKVVDGAVTAVDATASCLSSLREKLHNRNVTKAASDQGKEKQKDINDKH